MIPQVRGEGRFSEWKRYEASALAGKHDIQDRPLLYEAHICLWRRHRCKLSRLNHQRSPALEMRLNHLEIAGEISPALETEPPETTCLRPPPALRPPQALAASFSLRLLARSLLLMRDCSVEMISLDLL